MSHPIKHTATFLALCLVPLTVLSLPALAGSTTKKAECESDISDCYATMEHACPGGFQIVDRKSYYADGLVRELPPRTLFLAQQYNEDLYSCR